VECVHHFTTGSNGLGRRGDYEYGNKLSGSKHDDEFLA